MKIDVKTFISELLKHQAIKDALITTFKSEITEQFESRIELENRLEEMEQYNRRTCLKFIWTPEPTKVDELENTNEKVLNTTNTDILKHSEEKLSIEHIGRSLGLGQRKPGVPRNIVMFSTYWYRALVYRNKRFLKDRNDLP